MDLLKEAKDPERLAMSFFFKHKYSVAFYKAIANRKAKQGAIKCPK
jgi:hypothetical protein